MISVCFRSTVGSPVDDGFCRAMAILGEVAGDEDDVRYRIAGQAQPFAVVWSSAAGSSSDPAALNGQDRYRYEGSV